MNLPSQTSMPPVTISRVYTGTDVALRFLALLPDLGVIGVVGILAYGGKIEASASLLALLAVLAGRLNPASFAKTLGGASGVIGLAFGFGSLIRKIL